LECIDSAFGLRNVAGNTGLYLRLLERFRASQRDAGIEIGAAFEAARAHRAAARAHALRGVAGNIGARVLQALAQEVEEAAFAVESRPANLAARVAALQAALDATMQALDSYFDARAAGTEAGSATATGTPAAAGNALAQLETLLAEFSGEALDYFESVRGALAVILDADVLGRLAGHLSRYEFLDARAVLANAARAPDAAVPCP
jgi:HPt (histidine-containing phosphotransfer) domain-containing protein